MRRRTLVPLALLAAVLPGGTGGCIFDPREPEAEAGVACFVATPAEQPIQVVENLDGSLRCIQPPEYTRQLSPEFVFIPAPSVQAAYPDLVGSDGSWGIDQETQFIDTLSGEVESRLLERLIDRSGTSEVLIEAEYEVTVTADGSEILYTGEAFYTFRQEQTVWVLVRWEEKEAASPLGALKAALVSGR